MTQLAIGRAELSDPQVRTLVEEHQRDMHAVSPPGTSFALDVTGLQGPEITLFGAWEGEELVAIGALKMLHGNQAEIKSMRTRADHLGKGAASAILAEIIAAARHCGVRRLSLETGTGAPFTPAVSLYTRRGFRPGPAFAGYRNGPHNQCYHLEL